MRFRLMTHKGVIQDGTDLFGDWGPLIFELKVWQNISWIRINIWCGLFGSCIPSVVSKVKVLIHMNILTWIPLHKVYYKTIKNDIHTLFPIMLVSSLARYFVLVSSRKILRVALDPVKSGKSTITQPYFSFITWKSSLLLV